MRFSSFTYLVGQGLHNLRANRLMTFASMGVLTVCMLLIGAAYLLGVNIDSKYWIYDRSLALVMETGWAHYGNPKGSVWNTTTRDFTGNVQDAWKVALGLKYWY